MKASHPLVSVIITSNSLERLRDLSELLGSISRQVYKNVEVLIVIAHSRELFERLTSVIKNTRVHLVFEPRLINANKGRNHGLILSSGDIVVFLDDDVILPEAWIETLVSTFSDDEVVGATGPIRPLWQNRVYEWFPSELEWLIGCSGWFSKRDLCEIRGVLGTNASFRREAVRGAGGYADELGPRGHFGSTRDETKELGEETELSLRIRRFSGGKIVYNPRLLLYHKVQPYKLTIGFLSRRAFQVGRTRRVLRTLFARYRRDDVFDLEKRLVATMFVSGLLQLKQLLRQPTAIFKVWGLLGISVLFVVLGFSLPTPNLIRSERESVG